MNRRLWGTVSLLMTSILWLDPVSAAAQQVVVYNHKKNCPTPKEGESTPKGCYLMTDVDLKPGEPLYVEIRETFAQGFEYVIRGYSVITEEQEGPEQAPLSFGAPVDTVVLRMTHDDRFGGYIVTIRPRVEGATNFVDAAMLIIAAKEPRKPYAFSGGISFTNISSDPYIVRTEFDSTFNADGDVASVDTVQRVRIDESRRDAATVGFATFLTVNLPKFPKFDLSRGNVGIGIGLETSGQTQYYLGLAYETHNGIFLNAGAVLGRVSTLPSGIILGDEVEDPNILVNLGTRSEWGLYFGLSFTFLGGGQAAFNKPFAGGGSGGDGNGS